MTDADEPRLDTLPTDILLIIFDFCDAFDFIKLSEVCWRFNEIIAQDILWYKKKDKPFVTNQASRRFRDRCNILLCLRKRWHVSQNWLYGKYLQRNLLSWTVRAIPWLHLTKDILWWSTGDEFCAFHRRRSRNSKSPTRYSDADKIYSKSNLGTDLWTAVIRDNWAISSHKNGYIVCWNMSSDRNLDPYLFLPNAHDSNIKGLDEVSGVIISGSSDCYLKMWRHSRDDKSYSCIGSINLSDRILSVSANATNGKCAVGCSGVPMPTTPIRIFDTETLRESVFIINQWRHGAGTLDMMWENPDTLLTCGYDTCVRKWDIRTGGCVASWSDPTDAAVYCLKSDYRNAIITGTQYNCKAVLWDQRVKKYMQLYFLRNVRGESSPIYDIDFDSSGLYAATDRCLIQLKFSGYNHKRVNYHNILNNRARRRERKLSW